jgi:predicted PurR-regulated permease PerM
MDQTNQFPPINTMPNSTPPMNGMPSPFPSAEKPKKFGPIIAILLVILVIVIVALYLLASRVSVSSEIIDNTPANNMEQTIQTANTNTAPQEVAPITNTADDIDSLQADLDTSISGIDAQSI